MFNFWGINTVLFYRWQKIFMIPVWNKIANYWNKPFLTIIILLIVLFLDAIREMKKYSNYVLLTLITQLAKEMGIPVENEKLQQTLNEKGKCENEQALEEDNQKLRKETEKLKAELKKISNALSKATNEVTAVKKQSEGLKREYDRLMKEHERLQVGGCGSLHEQNVLKLC
uniref:Endoplasmic reticulum transmembrane protein n=1 Tax=Gopherus agassizii TaxID=38772 RepID=A0A452I1Y2_9SAUR